MMTDVPASSAEVPAAPAVAIGVHGLGKRFEIYAQPRDRLLQSIFRGRRQFFKEFWALSDVSFSVARGETVGIVGRNGSGKSTLLQLVAGTLSRPPDPPKSTDAWPRCSNSAAVSIPSSPAAKSLAQWRNSRPLARRIEASPPSWRSQGSANLSTGR